MHWLTHHLPLIAAIFGCLVAVAAIALAPIHVLREPIVVTRGYLYALALFIGLLGGAGIILGQASLDRNAAEGAARRHDLHSQIERERARDRRVALSRREVQAIAKRTARLERPTARDLLDAIHRAAQACRAEPAACARAASGFRSATQTPTRPGGPGRRGDTTPPRGTTTTPAPAPGAHPQRPSSGSPSSPPAPSPGTGSTPAPTRPPVEINPPPALGPIGPIPPIQLPPVPPVCTGVVNVNCPTPRSHRLVRLTARPPRLP